MAGPSLSRQASRERADRAELTTQEILLRRDSTTSAGVASVTPLRLSAPTFAVPVRSRGLLASEEGPDR